MVDSVQQENNSRFYKFKTLMNMNNNERDFTTDFIKFLSSIENILEEDKKAKDINNTESHNDAVSQSEESIKESVKEPAKESIEDIECEDDNHFEFINSNDSVVFDKDSEIYYCINRVNGMPVINLQTEIRFAVNSEQCPIAGIEEGHLISILLHRYKNNPRKTKILQSLLDN